MITGIRGINIKVRDQQRAKEFWTEKVGLHVVSEAPMPDFPGKFWMETAPPSDNSKMILHWPIFDEVEFFSGITFLADDVRETVAELEAKGVEIVTPPISAGFGWWATFRDIDGNVFVVRDSKPAEEA
jgi:predicted enzyme related to lactoylglutathione lyase